MEPLFDIILSTRFIVLVMAVVAGLLIYTLLKQLFRMALIVAAIFMLYAGYLVYTGQELPGGSDDLLRALNQQTDKVSHVIKEKGPVIMEELSKMDENNNKTGK